MPWERLVDVITRYGGSILAVPEEATHPLYDEARAAGRPQREVVLQRRPAEYARFVAAHGYPLVSVPGGHAFSFLPPAIAAQLTGAMGEPDRPWSDVLAEREAGRSDFGWVMFAGSDLAEVEGWAFGPAADGDGLAVWLVEDSVPMKIVGTFDEWLATRADELEPRLRNVQAILARNETASDDDWVEVDDAPTSIAHL